MAAKKKTTKTSAGSLLDKHSARLLGRVGPRAAPLPAGAIAVIDEANARRLAGERISIAALARILIEEFEIKMNPQSLTVRIRQHVGRDRW